MKGKTRRKEPTEWLTLEVAHRQCSGCGQELKWNYTKRRLVATLAGVVRLEVRICLCVNPACESYRHPCHPEEEGRLVLPFYGYGLDVVALIGTLRYREHESVPQIHARLLDRGLQIGERNVTYLIERYDELVALSVDRGARNERLRAQGRGDPGDRRLAARRGP